MRDSGPVHAGFLGPAGSGTQKQQPSRSDIHQPGGIEIDSMVTSEVIETYYSTIERGFRQTGLPRFIIAGKNQ